MDNRTAASLIRMAARIVCFIAVAAILTVAAGAQTPSSITGKPKSQPDLFQTPAAKTTPVKRTKSCSSYGDGFVYVPGTDTCVKTGGYLGIDAGGSNR